jgi:flagellar protein FlaG
MRINGMDAGANNIVKSTQKAKQIELNTVDDIQQRNNDVLKENEKKDNRKNELDKNSIKEISEALNNIVDITSKGLRFKVHDESQRIYVEVVNTKTNEVIKEIPPKELLDLASRIEKMVGLFVDEHA